MVRSDTTRLLRVLGLLIGISAACTPPPASIKINSPLQGAFMPGASVTVTGQVLNTTLLVAQGQVQVNGVNVTVAGTGLAGTS